MKLATRATRHANWLLAALIVRTAMALFFCRDLQAGETPSAVWGKLTGDTASYIDPVESLVAGGGYVPDIRMPGYGAVYLPLRLVLEPAHALNGVLALQVLLSAFSVHALSRVAAMAFPSAPHIVPAVFLAYLVSTYTAIFDVYLSTESFAASALVLATLAFLHGRERESHLMLAASGSMFTWAFFLRPVLVGLPLIFGATLLCVPSRWPLRRRLLQLGAFVLPLLVGDGAWTARNYYTHGVLQPLVPRYAPYYREVDLALFRFLQAWGGSMVHWNPKAEIVWFEYVRSQGYALPPAAASKIRFPEDIYTSRFDVERLVGLKERLRESVDRSLPGPVRVDRQAAVARELREYAESIRVEKPFVYYVAAPLRLLRSHLVHSGTYNLLDKTVSQLNPAELAFKGLMSALYWWVLVFGLAGCVLALRSARRLALGPTLLVASAAYVVAMHVFVARLDEYRYFVPAYPFLLVLACYATLSLRAAARPAARPEVAVQLN